MIFSVVISCHLVYVALISFLPNFVYLDLTREESFLPRLQYGIFLCVGVGILHRLAFGYWAVSDCGCQGSLANRRRSSYNMHIHRIMSGNSWLSLSVFVLTPRRFLLAE